VGDVCALATGLEQDCDNNGVPDSCQPDCNLNGRVDACDILMGTSLDLNADSIPDDCQIACPSIQTYCTAKVNSLGCSPAIAGLGVPSTSAPSGFIVSCSQVLPNRSGQMFYGRGQNSAPFQGGFICVQSPLRRTPLQVASNGTGCGGTYAFDFNVWMASGVDPSLVAGSNVFACWWMRDPGASFNTGVSNAMTFTICP
jgi:hypothetical protein